jgi:hypothetical protein
MKQGSNTRRPRGRNNGKRSSNRNSSYDSGGQEGKIRGNASQVHDKYLALARDALSADDRIASENYSQHAEHFFRLMAVNAENQNQKNIPKAQTVNDQKIEENSNLSEQANGAQVEDQKDQGRVRRNRKNSRRNSRHDNGTSQKSAAAEINTNTESHRTKEQPQIIEIESNAETTIDSADI